jgi:predicted ester cyclase
VPSLQETNKAIVRKFNKEFIENGNDAVYDEIVSPDFNNHDGGGDPTPGGQGARDFFTKVFRPAFPDVAVIIHEQFADGDAVITRKTYQGTHKGEFFGMPATNKKISISVIEIIRLRDGKYAEHWATADMLGAMKQMQGP